MKEFFDDHASNIGFIICVICAATLAFFDVSGWGWFLFIAFLVGANNHD